MVTVQAAQLDDGALAVPNGTQHLYMEIGCSDRQTLDERLDPQDKGFLIAFEPLIDKYAVLLSRGTTQYHGNTTDGPWRGAAPRHLGSWWDADAESDPPGRLLLSAGLQPP